MFVVFRPKTTYGMGICDWSSDGCASCLASSLAGVLEYLPVKSTACLHSSEIDSEAMIASYFVAIRPGIMPSQSCTTNSHSNSAAAQSALAMSMSKPTRLPLGSDELNGG